MLAEDPEAKKKSKNQNAIANTVVADPGTILRLCEHRIGQPKPREQKTNWYDLNTPSMHSGSASPLNQPLRYRADGTVFGHAQYE